MFCKKVSEKISLVPENFNINPKMVGQLARRAKMGEGETPMDWGFAEAIAFGSLVLDGIDVRLSGQDSGRGTFSHRHSLMYDTQNGAVWCPLAEISNRRNAERPISMFSTVHFRNPPFSVLNTVIRILPKISLVMWEAQFGDFSNGAQVIIDQYISASEDKWKEQMPSRDASCRTVTKVKDRNILRRRLERYLQLCAENNMQVCYPTTPAQYFHMLAAAGKTGNDSSADRDDSEESYCDFRRRVRRVEDLTTGGFQPVIDDASITR